jgi:hypothetical protein
MVEDVPRHLSHDRKSTHSIYFPDSEVCLQLKLKGVIPYLDTRYLTKREVDTCQWLIMMGDEEWLPYDDSFAQQEDLSSNVTSLNDPKDRVLMK